MKKLTLGIFTAFMLFSVFPIQLQAGTAPKSLAETTAPSPESKVLIDRLYEIKAMDLKNLKAAEKKQLRQEVKAIKADLKANSQGVYLSVGAILIIILLLILIL